MGSFGVGEKTSQAGYPAEFYHFVRSMCAVAAEDRPSLSECLTKMNTFLLCLGPEIVVKCNMVIIAISWKIQQTRIHMPPVVGHGMDGQMKCPSKRQLRQLDVRADVNIKYSPDDYTPLALGAGPGPD
jgi:hypothetical protein